MNSNAEFEALASELRALRGADGGQTRVVDESVLVARLLPGFSVNKWQDFLRHYPTARWCALPVRPGLLPDLSAVSGNAPAHLAHLLMAEMFIAQIHRELLRLTRTGGDLALVEASLLGREALAGRLEQDALQNLDARLVDCLQQCREECDSLGCTGPGRFALLLPGVSMLRARLMAEQMQHAYTAHAADAAAGTGGAPQCAIGIACATQGGRSTPESLLQKAEKALREAQAQKRGHIHVSESAALDARGTLVHSSEKRFLFFGGN